MSETIFKPQTYGRFELVGFLTGLSTECFNKNLVGKNNANWIYSRMNVRLTDGNGKNFYLNVQDGYSTSKGKAIYARDKGGEQFIVDFAERTNEEIRKLLSDNSFIKLGTGKSKKPIFDKEGKPVMENGVQKEAETWDYKRFLTQYDLINFLSTVLQEGQKVQITGSVKYNEYNGKTNRELSIQRIFFLPQDSDVKCKFSFTQNILLDADSVDDSMFETENFANIKAMVYQKKKKDEYVVLPLNMVIRATDENKPKMKAIIDKYFKVQGDTIRKINVEGLYNLGFISTAISESDLPEELLELIELGIYTKEEILKKQSNREKVDEMQIVKPALTSDDVPRVDYSDDIYTKEDLENLVVATEEEEEIIIDVTTSKQDELDFLNELDI